MCGAATVNIATHSLLNSGQRRLSLRFLAWYFLNIDMQSQLVEGHDSVEDALTALKVRPQGLRCNLGGSRLC